MRILVTGGAGFIGSHLCQKFIDEGKEVICLDNLSTGCKSNIEKLLSYNNFSLINHDVTIPIDINVDYIYNLACPASPIQYQQNPVNTIKTSVIGAINMLELAQKNQAQIFQASTSEIYGDPLQHPQTESYNGNVNTTGCRSCYDEGKRCAETLFSDFNKQYNVDIRIARIFNTYGPNMLPNDGRVISNFIIQALRGDDITIYGKGNQTRSFQYIDDLITGILLLNKSSITTPVNIGNPEEVSILHVAEKIINLTNTKSKIIFRPLPTDDPTRRKPDITLAINELKWNPTVKLTTGLERTIEYFEQKVKEV